MNLRRVSLLDGPIGNGFKASGPAGVEVTAEQHSCTNQKRDDHQSDDEGYREPASFC